MLSFISHTVDGTTDLAGINQESIYLRSCSGGLVTQRMCVGKRGCEDIHAFILQMIKCCISQFFFKLVGFGSDGASKVQGVKTGVG